ncbi:DUF6457 domain-containing protein [Agromyces laixinhei]|uniref:DUF6457 domain-containing protein n=1 Tax=Agromyces laixinhei TaxID=2585717 RepID=UPI00143D2D36|nr:DUF6457 domain-containing protein [Agromyces laixinhei]
MNGWPGLEAVVLAGGRSSRLGGSPKAELVIGGTRLVDIAVDAAATVAAQRIVVVGPDSLGAGRESHTTSAMLTAREEPPFGGPVAGLAAGLTALDRAGVDHSAAESDTPANRWVLVLACDLPHAGDAAVALIDAARRAEATVDGVCLDDGRQQWLTAVYRRDALARAFDSLHDPNGASMRTLVHGLALTSIVAADGLADDVDTWDDLERARRARPPHSPATAPATEGADMSTASHSPESLDEWIVALAAELGIDPAAVPVGDILDLARDVAHGVARPAAPLSTFLVGLAAGAGNGSIAELSARATVLAEGWPPDPTA